MYCRQIKIIHVITGLSTGGAEMMLYKLLSAMDREKFNCEVISLTDAGEIFEKISNLGVPVISMGMKHGRPHPVQLWKLKNLLKNKSPDVVQTWLYHSDLIGGLAAKIAGDIQILWNIRQARIDTEIYKVTTVYTAKVCAMLSKWIPDKIISCSQTALQSHMQLGYVEEKFLVIPNGFDLSQYKPDSVAAISVRNELGLSSETPLVGLFARFHPQKDHHNFIAAAALVHDEVPSAHFILCGSNISDNNPQLIAWIKENKLEKYFHLLDIRKDIPRLTASLDVAVSSSLDEGFPNAIGEAMACAVPCVVTNVGDSASLVGKTGRIVEPGDPHSLSMSIIELLQLEPKYREKLGMLAKQRIEKDFSIKFIANQYEAVYRELTNK
jgi:glycosyltransferase involved in cell wall biosynthesis